MASVNLISGIVLQWKKNSNQPRLFKQRSSITFQIHSCHPMIPHQGSPFTNAGGRNVVYFSCGYSLFCHLRYRTLTQFSLNEVKVTLGQDLSYLNLNLLFPKWTGRREKVVVTRWDGGNSCFLQENSSNITFFHGFLKPMVKD